MIPNQNLFPKTEPQANPALEFEVVTKINPSTNLEKDISPSLY